MHKTYVNFSGHDHGDEEQKAYFILCGKLAVMVGIIYLFWLLESVLAIFGKRNGLSIIIMIIIIYSVSR